MNVRLTVRNAVVLSLTAGLAELFRLPEGLFMVLAVLLSLEGSIGQGQKAARERIVGTLCGTAVCLLLLGLLQWTGVPAATLGLTLVRVLGHGLGLNSGFIVGGHVVAGSVANHSSDWPAYLGLRSLETLAGVLIAVLAARWILPARASHRLELALERWRGELAVALRQADLSPAQLGALRGGRDQLLDLLPFAREELLPSLGARALSGSWDQQLFHGGALLSSLRDLRQLCLSVPIELKHSSETLLEHAADLLEAGLFDGGREGDNPGQASLNGLRQAAIDLGRLGGEEAIDQQALWIHRSRMIGLHAEAMMDAAQGARPSTSASQRSTR
ncbi:FUSC family protein [Synechococcus sp. Tobar12-5m-g]|uniref:FUSC family protein n=1 Tax=unclassified Synechococcus TaxID=2626047 RepID=UPI0020CBCF47|nr:MULTISPECIES: FUSC family protein [unclassified Synechococcus]MCP9771045.1 FUSC family protein [Synechococcus sp. Tobar12-5m-g]MCP9871985.1 FUSC family protein [Synechococcus sp. Cruz CV-v-12]